MESIKTFITKRVSITGLNGQESGGEANAAVPIHEYARDSKGRYDKDVLMKLLSKRQGISYEEMDFVFEYLMVGD